jgi:hypothetical protein
MFKDNKGMDLLKKMRLLKELIYPKMLEWIVLFKCYLFRLAVIKP